MPDYSEMDFEEAGKEHGESWTEGDARVDAGAALGSDAEVGGGADAEETSEAEAEEFGQLLDETYRDAPPLKKAFIQASLDPACDYQMEYMEDGFLPDDAIVLPAGAKGHLTLAAAVLEDAVLLVFATEDGHEHSSPYADVEGRATDPLPGVDSLDDEAVFSAFRKDFPATAQAVDDLRDRLDEILEAYADAAASAAALGLESGDFSSPVYTADTFFPTDEGLFFPNRGEAGEWVPYDAPEAQQCIDTLLDGGWDGQTFPADTFR